VDLVAGDAVPSPQAATGSEQREQPDVAPPVERARKASVEPSAIMQRPPAELLGTSVQFVNNPLEAAHIAEREGKLLFVLHVSGNFEDPQFT
jgi:hypothetical protein